MAFYTASDHEMERVFSYLRSPELGVRFDTMWYCAISQYLLLFSMSAFSLFWQMHKVVHFAALLFDQLLSSASFSAPCMQYTRRLILSIV